MSYLSIALQRRAERRQLTQADIARESGISRSYISRLFSGEHHELSDPNFIALLKIFTADPVAQAELTAARCMDVRVGPGSELVEIRVKNPEPKARDRAPSGSDFSEVELDRESERAFAYLRSKCPVNADLQQHLVSYARLLGMK